jgi:hypothetical protein
MFNLTEYLKPLFGLSENLMGPRGPVILMIVGISLGVTFGAVVAYSVLTQARQAYQNERIAPKPSQTPSPSQKLSRYPPTDETPAVRSILAEPGTERVFVPSEIDFAFLDGLYQTHTNFHADKLIQSYLGKWMRFSTTVRNVRIGKDPKYPVAVTIGGEHLRAPLVHLELTTEWQERVSMLQRGSRIRAIGRIVSNSELEACELLDAD